MDKANFRPVKFYETWTFVIIVCIILPIAFRAFLYSPRHIPSSSMKPTLLIGDYLFISKFAYGYSKFSFPFGYKVDYFEGRTGDNKPKRGDIIVFRPPNQPDTDYIKRLIGLPGDTIQMINGKLILNGELLPLEREPDFMEETLDGRKFNIKRYKETLPNGVSYSVLDQVKDGAADNTEIFAVPEGYYFFMGDNRDNSEDSRKIVGYVPEENLIGKAEIILFSNKSPFVKIWQWFGNFREGRMLIDLDENN